MMVTALLRRLGHVHSNIERAGIAAFSSLSENFPAGNADWAFPRTVHFGSGRSAELPSLLQDGNNLEARSNMMAASSMAAVAFQKGLGAVHGLSEPTGAVYNTQHGVTNAVILPYVLRWNRPAIESKLEKLARCLGLEAPPSSYCSSPSGFEAVAYWIDSLLVSLNIPQTLTDIGIDEFSAEETRTLAEKAVANATGFTNPIELSIDDYISIIHQARRGRDRTKFEIPTS